MRAGMLGRCRYFAKKALVYQIPIFGWSLWAVGMILVSRNWTSDQALIKDAFERVKENKHDCWIVLYPEGTRFTPRKTLESQAFARKHGKAELSRVLLPRTKGFVSTVQGRFDHCCSDGRTSRLSRQVRVRLDVIVCGAEW
jgi:1-acyl-sn-glycerol-3-phosphate acyltransferase